MIYDFVPLFLCNHSFSWKPCCLSFYFTCIIFLALELVVLIGFRSLICKMTKPVRIVAIHLADGSFLDICEDFFSWIEFDSSISFFIILVVLCNIIVSFTSSTLSPLDFSISFSILDALPFSWLALIWLTDLSSCLDKSHINYWCVCTFHGLFRDWVYIATR